MTGATDERVRRALSPLPCAWQPGSEQRAAVLLPLLQQAGRDGVLFTVRRADLRQHAGQIAFPGGLADADEDAAACARREASEEIGAPAATALLGHLGARLSSSNYRVHCLVGRLPAAFTARLEPREVERLLWLPLDELLQLERWKHESTASDASGRTYPASPHFRSGSDVVWGLTGRFLFDFVQALAQAAG